MTSESLKWSAQLTFTSNTRRLQGDKITLPQSALESLLAAAPLVSVRDRHTRLTQSFDPYNEYSFEAERYAREALSDRQQQLPHPLTFRLTNPTNGRTVYAGIREFSAEEGTIGLSGFLTDALGLTDIRSDEVSREASPDKDASAVDGTVKTSLVTVHAHQLSKGTYVRLRPLEAGYDADDWKSLLERHLRDNFTTLTNGEILDISPRKNEHFKLLIDKFEPEGDGICIVDTDLEVDIEALNEEQARETLNRRLAKSKRAPGTEAGSSAGGLLMLNDAISGQVLPGDYVDYDLKNWNKKSDLEIVLEAEDGADIDLLISPFSTHQRSKPRIEEHTFANLTSQQNKRIKLSHTNVDVEEAEAIWLSVYANIEVVGDVESMQPIQYSLTTRQHATIQDTSLADEPSHPSIDEVICKNCHHVVAKRTLPLHEAFCYRNNIACPKCQQVFLKNSDTWRSHWHCEHDDEYGNSSGSQKKHDSYFHPSSTLECQSCGFEAYNIPILAQHCVTTCPGKEILCQFCHLVVPQQGPDDPSFADAEVLLSGLTPHELADGGRTTECHLCSKIVRLRDMRTHMLFHDRDRISKTKPMLCTNVICGRTIRAGKEATSASEQYGLCDECFGPLHGTTYDPEGKALRRRIERRLLQQLMGGCGKEWCQNAQWCRTGKKNSTGEDTVVTAKEALPLIKPTMNELSVGETSGLRFCVDDAAQSRRAMAEMIAAEGVYDLAWTVKALEEEKNNLGGARDWLKDRAPKIDEVVT